MAKSRNPFKAANEALGTTTTTGRKSKAAASSSTGVRAQKTVRQASIDAAIRRKNMSGKTRSSTNKGKR